MTTQLSAAPHRVRNATARPTIDEIRAWPATVSVEQSARAFGVSRAHAYEAIKLGTYPARALKVGGRTTVITASILRALEPSEV